MKKILFVIIAIVTMVSCSTNEQYLIKGTLEGGAGEMIYLQQNTGGKLESIDSVAAINGSFEFSKGSVDVPAMYYVAVQGKRGALGLFLENTEMAIEGHIDSIYIASVTGSATQDLYNSFNAALKPYYDKNSLLYREYRDAREAQDEEKTAELSEKRKAISEEIKDYQITFIKENPGSFVTPVVLRSISYGMDTDELENYCNGLDENVAESQIIKDLKVRIEALRKVEVGQIAPDFTQNDIDGNPVMLSELKGHKLLLIDFWAAWCGPCRAENPNVVAVYNEFNALGFDVLGVSLDKEKDAWLKAIEDDNLSWTHVSDLAYWSNAAAKLYAVNSIPANFLIDADGKILARGLRGEDLRNMVAELLAAAE